MSYAIVTAETMLALVELVQNRIAEGWQPLGGVAFAGDLWAQAMTRKRRL